MDHHRGSEEQQPGEAYFDPELFDSTSGCVDTFPAFRRTLAAAGLEGTVVPLVCPSALAARGWATPLSLVFIDGGHSFEAAHGDYRAWSGHLLPGGYLLIHDIFLDPAAGGQAPREVYRIGPRQRAVRRTAHDRNPGRAAAARLRPPGRDRKLLAHPGGAVGAA